MQKLLRLKNKKRILAGIIVIGLMLAFSACGGTGDEGGSGDVNGNNDGNINNGDNGVLDDGMTWSTPEMINTGDFNVHDIDIAVAGNDRFAAVWDQNNPTATEAVYASEVTGSVSWSQPQQISADAFAVSDGPEIHINGNGSGIVVWGEQNLANPLITQRSLVYDSAGGFGGVPGIIYSGNLYAFTRGDVSVADSGNAVFAGNLGTRIWASSYDGIGWSGGGNIDDGSGYLADEPALAGNSSGTAFAVWTQNGEYILAARYDGSAWEASEEISAGDGNKNPHVAADENNNAIAVWMKKSGSSYNIYAAVHTHGSGWNSGVSISSNGRAAGSNPQIAFDGSGNAVAVWEENDGFNRTIYANRYTAGSGWGTDSMIGNLSGSAEDPMIAVNSAGKAVAVWEQEENGAYNIYSARYIPGAGGWMPVELLETDSGDSRNGNVAVDENGYAVAVWQYDDGSYTRIKTARLR